MLYVTKSRMEKQGRSRRSKEGDMYDRLKKGWDKIPYRQGDMAASLSPKLTRRKRHSMRKRGDAVEDPTDLHPNLIKYPEVLRFSFSSLGALRPQREGMLSMKTNSLYDHVMFTLTCFHH